MNFPRFLSARVVRHAAGWLLLLGLLAGLGHLLGVGRLWLFGVPYAWAVLLGPAVAIYAHYALLTHCLERRHWGLYLLGTAGALLLGAGILAYQAAQPLPAQPTDAVLLGLTFHVGPMRPAVLLAAWLAALGPAVANVLVVLGLATLARYGRRSISRRLQLPQLRAQQLETELNLLKAQVNQHFLFNTLNNFYGLALTRPEHLAEALLQLADLLRYQLDSSRHTPVTVGTEAAYLRNYIALEQLRLPPSVHVDFQTDLDQPDQPMAPLLLLPLVENCFKHAIAPGGEGFIQIRLKQVAGHLTLRTENSVPPQYRPAPSGVGLPTLQARLDRFYPGRRHQLALGATQGQYAATLTLVL